MWKVKRVNLEMRSPGIQICEGKYKRDVLQAIRGHSNVCRIGRTYYVYGK